MFLRMELLAARSVHQQSDEGGDSGTNAVVRQQRIFELVFADHDLGVLQMQLRFGQEHLHVLRHIRREVFDRPRAEDCLLVLNLLWIFHIGLFLVHFQGRKFKALCTNRFVFLPHMPGAKNKARFGFCHLGALEVLVFQRRAANV